MPCDTVNTTETLVRDKPGLEALDSPAPALTPKASLARQNNIGFIRLLAASMVIVSHSAELIDGDRIREPLSRLFGTLSFGDLGVDIFFLISGYLITKSYLTSAPLNYLAKRVNRIYPGYLVAYALSVLVVAPLAGIALSSLGAGDWLKAVGHSLWLDMPRLEGSFAGGHYHYLNGAMWTISYEFRCYLFVMLAGTLGVYRKRLAPLCVAAVFLALHFVVVNDVNPSGTGWFVVKEVLLGNLVDLSRFLFIFMSGSLFYLFRDKIRYTGSAAFLSTLALMVFLFSDRMAEPALCTLGAYGLFYFAFATKRIDINNSYDISYGVYLYAWPFAALVLTHFPTINQVGLSFATFVFAVIAGTASWYLVEKPAAKLLRFLPERVISNRLRGNGELHGANAL